MNVREALDNIYKEFEKTYEEARKEGYNAGFENGNISDGTFDKKIKEAYENGANDAWELAYKLEESPLDFNDGIERKDIWGYMDVEDIINQLTGAQALAELREYEAKLKEQKAKLKEQVEQVFKTGDRVRTTGERDKDGNVLFPVGTIGEVMTVDCDGECLVKAYETYAAPYYYPYDALELANDVILVGDEVYFLDSNYHGVVTAVWDDCGVVKTERLTQSGKLACDDAKDLHRTGRRFPEIANILKQMQEGNE